MKKECIKCNVEKEINSDNFKVDKRCSDGCSNVCKECYNAYRREGKKWEKEKEKMRQYMKKKRKDPEFRKLQSQRKKERRITDDEYRKRENKKQRKREKERRRTDDEYRRRVNREIYERRKERMKSDPVYRFKFKIRKRIRIILKERGYTKKSKTHEILGISYEEFSLYMERQFVKGMSWDNYGEWHIDHIIPLATAQCENDVIRLNHYSNLQPLWAHDNLSKGSKIIS